MTAAEFYTRADQFAEKAGVRNAQHGYFLGHRSRIYESCRRFGLFDRSLGDVLEVGPFYSYTPLLLRSQAHTYSVLEGDDAGSVPLFDLYREADVDFKVADLFSIFGSDPGATFRLPYPDASFDTVLCWETMEHFNFNPVPFVRDLWRVCRPGARVCLTVPNRASGEALISILTGRNQRSGIDSYFKFADFTHNGRRVFLGFHWREYTLMEFSHLFSQAGFQIAEQGWLMTFQDMDYVPFARRLARMGWRLACRVKPSFGKNCLLVAQKPV